uniref:ATP-dependent DNA helicase n=2 Tax=Flexistipes TaxID=2351 RepID=UPI0023562F8F
FDDENYELYKKYRDKFKNIFNTEGLRLIEPHKNSFSLKNLPLSVSDSFGESLGKICVSSIFISATLSVNGSFDYFCNELGLSDVATKKVEGGGDFLKNGVCCIPEKEFYGEKKLEAYFSIIKKLEGGCLIIFNSLEMMNKVYNYLRMKKTGRQLILQTEVDLSQIDITAETVVLGCSIVREGIDFSGNNLKYVILDKLPFENISDVYLNARKEAFEKEYGNAFMNFYLPRAVIYFKQAVGRLIRHEDDNGAWIILDNRVLTKAYGKYFMDVLKDVQVCHRLSDLPSFAGGNNELH